MSYKCLNVSQHAHVSRSEVIGLLGGIYDKEKKLLKVSVVFKCRRYRCVSCYYVTTVRAGPTCVQISAAEPCNSVSTGLQCEMDPVSQTQACDVLSSLGLSVVGWYHSHPTFHPNPSVRDINTQDQFQVRVTTARPGQVSSQTLWVCRQQMFFIFIFPELFLTRWGPFYWDDRQPIWPSKPFPALPDHLFVGERESRTFRLTE